MSSNLLCKHCEHVIFCDFNNYKTFEGTFCRKLKKENPNCENCKELKKGEQNGESTSIEE